MNCKIRKDEYGIHITANTNDNELCNSLRLENDQDVVNVMEECQAYLSRQGHYIPSMINFIHQYFPEEGIPKEVGIGFQFLYKGEECRTVVRLNIDKLRSSEYPVAYLVKVFNMLQKAMQNPEALDVKAAFKDEILTGKEMVLE